VTDPAPLDGRSLRLTRPPAPRAQLHSVSPLARRPRPRAAEPVPLASVQGTLALDLDRPSTPATPELRVLDGRGDSSSVEEVRGWAARFAQAVVEVTGGDRPVQQLLRWTTAGVYQDLSRRVQVMGQTRSAHQRRSTLRPQVRTVHVCRPCDGVAEVSVHIRYGQRSRALAARLERRSQQWTCTALQLG
jgi:hypothetical protein